MGAKFQVGDRLTVNVPVDEQTWDLNYVVLERQENRVRLTDGKNLKGVWQNIHLIDGDEYVVPFGRPITEEHFVKAKGEA